MSLPTRRGFLSLSGAVLLAGSSRGLFEDDQKARPQAAGLQQVEVFTPGADGYHSYRIPSLFVTPKGTLLAFCEARKNSRNDAGDIDLVVKRGSDKGATWSAMRMVADDGPNTVGNPCPVVDRATGTIWLPLTRNLGNETQKQIVAGTSKGSRAVWVTKSTDDGLTWSKPIDITTAVKDPNWTWYATGPGCGIQLRAGRLVIPCDHYLVGTGMRRSHVIYSDDQGATWKRGGSVGDDTNECQVVEREDGTLLINMRSYHGKNRRAVATSIDGGQTWSEITLDQALIEPVCQASFVRYTTRQQGRGRLLFANPASSKRENMTLRLSYDDGRTWPVAKVLHPGPAAYSALAILPDLSIGCLYERGDKSAYDKLTFARLSLDWLTDGKDRI